MSASALHLNLLNATETKAVSPVRLKVIMPIATGIICGFVLLWGAFVGIQLLLLSVKLSSVESEIDGYAREAAENEALSERLDDLQAEAVQFGFYRRGRNEVGGLLREIAYAIPAGVTLKSLSIPEPPDQGLRQPAAMQLPPLQGPTSSVERVELRLIGVARNENAVFEMMENFKSSSMTGLVTVVEKPEDGRRESPRVVAFRQDNAAGGVFFDLIYDLRPREFVR